MPVQTCTVCGGSGVIETEICETCFGTGVLPLRGISFQIEKKFSLFANLSPTCKVASCIDSTEYLALVSAAKDGVKIVLSCGFVDMRDGQWARTTLFAIFDAQSVTRASLIAIFG